MVSFYNYLWILSFLKLNFTWFYINHPYGLIIKWKIAINPMLFLDWKWTRPNISGRNVFIQVAVQPRFVLFDQLKCIRACKACIEFIALYPLIPRLLCNKMAGNHTRDESPSSLYPDDEFIPLRFFNSLKFRFKGIKLFDTNVDFNQI